MRYRGLLVSNQPCGYFDMYVALALRFDWTPEMVNRIPPEIVEELMMAIEAEGKVHEERGKSGAGFGEPKGVETSGG